ncbi:NADP-dependent oxidoreductase domain-containing protein [Mycena albidolilacea]|uniref:NADP-dependent oxidoreductase domain-containing protein n=1 Tax=Mycena albidolilacea TaxID=1033008 RepID=A0AAD6ZFE3_9AGAR|nr:NADP-dependent oxidoreductase domain-containing protein [Mycena albidolilacea]
MPFGTFPLNDGRKLPAIAFGTGSIYKRTDVTRYVQQALDAGFSHIDTAQYYGTEQYVGDVIHDSGLARSDLYITTKYGFGDVQETIRKSLANLGLEYVDLYLIHQPRFLPDIDAVWKEFEIIKKDGLAKTIGVSNFTLEQLQSLVQKALVWPAVNQIEFHPYNYAKNKTLLEWSSIHGIVTEGYSSLSSITKCPGGTVDAPVAAAADRLGISPTQVLFSWVRAKGVVIVTTTSNKDRLEEYLAVGDLPPLSDAEIAAIDEAGAKGPPSALRVYSSVLRTKGWTAAIPFFLAFLFLGQLFLRTAFTVRMGI